MKLTPFLAHFKLSSNGKVSALEKLLLVAFSIIAAAFIIWRPALVSPAPEIAKPSASTPAASTVPANTSTSEQSAQDTDVQPKGIDLSHYQSGVNWQKVKASGISFVYAKATEGITNVDARFASHRAGAQAEALLFGAYHFFRPNDDPIKQAEHFLKTAAPNEGDLAPVLDLEIAPNQSEKAQYVANVSRWLKHVADQTGCTPMIYASPSFWREHLGKDLSEYGFWLAEYSSKPKPPETAPAWTFWQYSQRGKVAGINGLVDVDVAASGEALTNARCGGEKP